MTRLARRRYYESIPPIRSSYDRPVQVSYRQTGAFEEFPQDSDVYTLRVKRHIAVTPLSLDLTSRVDLGAFDKALRD
jgi:broad specificity polyphosphatase/5'/3'-nucleotidase SurE